jgi:cardiolipin synthase A/B
MHFRRTEQAILQIIDAARKQLILVSFAVYRIPNVGQALVRAAQRGVQLTVIVETPNKIEGEGEYSTIQALGQGVAGCSSVYYWPKENRPLSETGKVGLLHVKCVVADNNWLCLSSANLTQQAFTINMELGILIHGGTMPGLVSQQFLQLVQNGQFKKIY